MYLHIYAHMYDGKYCLYQLQNTQSIIHPDSYQSFPFLSGFGTGEQKRNGSLKRSYTKHKFIFIQEMGYY